MRGRLLNEIESWAVLCESVQTLQDRLLQINSNALKSDLNSKSGTFYKLNTKHYVAANQVVLISPENLKLTFEGNIEIDSCGPGGELHPQVSSIGGLGGGELEQIAIFSLGKTLIQSCAKTRYRQSLITQV